MTNYEKRPQNTYTQEQKDLILKRLLPPANESISDLSKEMGISKSTLNTWKSKAQKEKRKSSQESKTGKELTSKEKFLIVMETYSMPEIKLSEYCRTKGLYVEQIKNWQEGCSNVNGKDFAISNNLKNELNEEKRKSKTLEKELNRKEKALAEVAALLVLRKKLDAILGDQEEE